jgi:predicted HNH restriction endonuclease
MEFVSSENEIIKNVITLTKYLKKKNEFACGLIKRGKNFVAYKKNGEWLFSPSRFTGYIDNDKNKHSENSGKHGGKTDKIIKKILGNKKVDTKLEKEFQKFTQKFYITPRNGGRKYWIIQNKTTKKVQKDFEKQIEESQKDSSSVRKKRIKQAKKIPEQIQMTSVGFKRNPDVVVETLSRANGVCEKCNKNAPFLRKKDKTPYLEVHHKTMLSNGGEDTLENTIAVCPNCHRELHYG